MEHKRENGYAVRSDDGAILDASIIATFGKKVFITFDGRIEHDKLRLYVYVSDSELDLWNVELYVSWSSDANN